MMSGDAIFITRHMQHAWLSNFASPALDLWKAEGEGHKKDKGACRSLFRLLETRGRDGIAAAHADAESFAKDLFRSYRCDTYMNSSFKSVRSKISENLLFVSDPTPRYELDLSRLLPLDFFRLGDEAEDAVAAM